RRPGRRPLFREQRSRFPEHGTPGNDQGAGGTGDGGAAQRFALPRSAVYRCAATPPGEKAEVYGFGETATLGIGCRCGHRPAFSGSFSIAAAYRWACRGGTCPQCARQPEVAGVVQTVSVREGDTVKQ